MIHLELKPEVEAQLAAEAHAQGIPLDVYLQKIVQARPVRQAEPEKRSVSQAIERLLKLREQSSLGGLSIKDLINEGRKY